MTAINISGSSKIGTSKDYARIALLQHNKNKTEKNRN